MSELMILLFIVFVGALVFTSIQSIMILNDKRSFVYFMLTFLSISICFFILGWYFTSFSTLFFMFASQYIYKYLCESESQKTYSTEIVDKIDSETTTQNIEQNLKENNEVMDKQAFNLLISVCIFILLSGFTLYLAIITTETPNIAESQNRQTQNLLWFAVFAAILSVIYLLLSFIKQTKTETNNS